MRRMTLINWDDCVHRYIGTIDTKALMYTVYIYIRRNKV